MKHLILTSLVLLGMLFFSLSSVSAAQSDTTEELDLPPTLEELQNIPKLNKITGDNFEKPLDIRVSAMKEAAISYGARGGLARRTYEIRQELEGRSDYLDKVFDFSHLLIPAPSGLLIEPPIISESEDSMIIQNDGSRAAVADLYINIGFNSRIVSSARNWRQYLYRNFTEVVEPPDLLRPSNKEEREQWKQWVKKGWDQGIQQAEEIFEEDLNVLTADYEGMVRYRKLLAMGMISAPYAIQEDRGITGGGNEMRIGDREVQLSGVPQLKSGYNSWRPVSR